MSDPSSGWPAKFVVMVQLAAWCTVGILLLQMGMASLTPESAANNATTPAAAAAAAGNATASAHEDRDCPDNCTAQQQQQGPSLPPVGKVGALPEGTARHDNVSEPPTTTTTAAPGRKKGKTPQYRPSSVLMITVGSTMLILGPVVLMIREIESRRQYDRFTKVDPPPSYDEVTEAAPRYSSLFEVDESGQLVAVNPPPPPSPPPRERAASAVPAPPTHSAADSLLLKPRTNSVV